MVLDAKSEFGWWINSQNTQNERYYDITLNIDSKTLKVRFSQGTEFWLNGSPFVWGEKKDNYKAVANENGIVTWDDVVLSGTENYFRICGYYTYPYENQFYQGEWYYASESNLDLKSGEEKDVLPFVSDYNNSNWTISEAGKYKITFDSKKLKIKAEKQQ